MRKKEASTIAERTPEQPKRMRRKRLLSVVYAGIRCPHCGNVSDRHPVTNTYANGNRRRLCANCGRPFVTRFGR